MWKMYLIFRVLLLLYSIYIFIFFIFECYSLLINLVLEIIKHAERKKIWSKFYLTISNFLKKLAWLLWFWIEYGSNYLFFFQNLSSGRFQTLRRWDVMGASLISQHWIFGKLISWVLLTSMPIFRLVEFVELQN